MYLISRNEVSVQIDNVCLGHNSVRMKMASVKYTMKHVSYDSTGNVHEVHMQINKNSQVVKRTECISKRKMFKKYHWMLMLREWSSHYNDWMIHVCVKFL